MKRFRQILKVIGILLLALIATIGVILGTTFAGNGKAHDGLVIEGFARTVVDGYVSMFLLDAGQGQLALVDCGMDPTGHAILAELARRHASPDDVRAIFLTHGHRDHTGGCHLFSHAQTYALADEIPLVEGRAGSRGLLPRMMPVRDVGARVTRPVHDGEDVTVGDLTVRVFAVPGHTAGSAVYLTHGVLFMGDSADADSSGHLMGAKYWFSDDTAQNHAALRSLAARLSHSTERVNVLAFAHSGTLNGLQPLLDFAAHN